MDLALGFDFGTSGARAMVLDRSGLVLFQVKTSYELHSAPSWQLALTALIAQIPVSFRARIGSIAIDGTSATVLLVNGRGEPVTGPLAYNHSLSLNLEQIPRQSPARSSTSSLAKLLYWQENFPADLQGDTKPYFLHQADWIASLLHGQLGITDYHNALKLGYDVQHLQYPDWFPSVKFHLPQVLAPGTPVGHILPIWSEQWHLPKNCLVCAGTTDSNSATIACLGDQKLDRLEAKHYTGITILGSTLVLKVLSTQPIFDSAYGIYSHRWHDPKLDLYVAGGASNTGGAVLSHFFCPEELQRLSDRLDPDCVSPYDYYPLLRSGERFPISDPDLSPRLTPRPPEPHLFLHGLLESIARIEKLGYERLQSCGASYPTRVITAGGGAINHTWQAIRSRVLGVPVTPADRPDSAYGTALLALETLINNA